ncbi:MAG: hypothetical protein ACTSU5_02915, partial [Promethearchaeota archaeon]
EEIAWSRGFLSYDYEELPEFHEALPRNLTEVLSILEWIEKPPSERIRQWRENTLDIVLHFLSFPERVENLDIERVRREVLAGACIHAGSGGGGPAPATPGGEPGK